MKKMVMVAAVMLVAGCAEMPQLNSGRYLQARHPMNNAVVWQVTVPTEQGCSHLARVMEKENPGVTRCSPISQESKLPWRATARNFAYDFIIDVDSTSQFDCEDLSRVIVTGNERSVEVLKPCHQKVAAD